MYTLIRLCQLPPLPIRFASLALLLFTISGELFSQGTCLTPALQPVDYECDGGVSLTWSAVPGAMQYTVVVDDSAGVDVVNFINIPDTSLTIAAGTLTAGVNYSFSVTADCGDNMASATQGSIDGSAIQQLLPEIVLVSSEGTSCPDATDGSLAVTVDAYGCGSIFGLVLAGDTTAISAGDTLTFNNLDTGEYELQLLLDQAVDCNYTSACFDSIFTDVQLQSTDQTPPSLAVVNILGATPDSVTTFTPPEGGCGLQRTWVINTSDSCSVPALDVEVTTTSNNLSVFPGGSATVSYNGSAFIMELYAATGTNTITITSTDGDGNTASQTFIVEVVDTRSPVIQGPGDILVETPSCDTDTPVNWTVTTQDDCDLEPDLQQIAGPTSGSNLATGQYTVMYEAVDDYGNSSTYSFDITIQQGDSPAPVVDLSGNTQFSLSPCEEEAFVILSGNILDCTITPGTNVASDISVSGAPLSLGAVNVQPGYAYFELIGSLAPGFYSVELSYQGQLFQTTAVIVEQAPDQPAHLSLPGNLTFTIPACEDTLQTYIGISFQDDCEQAPNMDNLAVNLDGMPLPLIESQSSTNALVYELALTAESDGAELEVLYVDGAGNITEKAVTLSVVGQPDTEAPVLVYPAQHIYRQLDACDLPQQEICFNAQATDNCDPTTDVNVFVSDETGNLFPLSNPYGDTYCATLPLGDYTVSLQAEDEKGNSATAGFNIHINQESSSQVNLTCNDQINISLDENCSRRVTPDMLLEGSFGCLEDQDFLIEIDDLKPQNDSLLDGHGLFEYEIDLRPGVDAGPGFEPCWGYIRGMDNRDPTLSVPADTDEGLVEAAAFTIADTLTNADPTMQPSIYVCMIEAFPQTGLRFYELTPFQVTVTGYYTFLLTEGFSSGGGQLALFEDHFSPFAACSHMIARGGFPADSDLGPPFPALTLRLRAGVDYFLLTTTDVEGATGRFEYQVQPWEENAAVQQAATDGSFTSLPSAAVSYSLPLQCSDLDSLFNAPESQDIAGAAQALDNCGDVNLSVQDNVSSAGDCGNTVITRQFTAEDGAGNTVSGQQRITLRRLPAEEVVQFPAEIVRIACSESFATSPSGNPDPARTGYPFVATVYGPIELDGMHCNIAATYTDGPRAYTCNGTYKFARNWSVLDWCAPSNTLTFRQQVEVGDFTAPEVSAPAVDYNGDGQTDTPVFSTSTMDCTANFDAPLPVVTDVCSDWRVQTQIAEVVNDSSFNAQGQLLNVNPDTVVVRTINWNAPNRRVTGLPVGDYLLRYLVTDDCGNSTLSFYPLQIRDRVTPVAVCDNSPVISLSGDDFGRIFADALDNGSWDNCGVERLEIRRNLFNPNTGGCGNQWSEWEPSIDFSCCDVGETIMVELQVVDGAGNTNRCMTEIVPEEKTRPTCIAPASVNLSCEQVPAEFNPESIDELSALFGAADATDNCAATVQELPPLVNIECRSGTILRRFRATDSFGNESINTCQQLIRIEETHNFEIRFPADEELLCAEGPSDSVRLNTIGCDILAVNFSDQVFDGSGDVCQTVQRTWRVINWCQYDGLSDPFVVSRDTDCDLQTGEEPVWVLHRPDGFTYIDRDNDETEDNNIPTAGENLCQGFDDYWQRADYQGGYYQYLQIIKVVDDIAPTLTFTQPDPFCSLNNTTCEATISYPFTVDESCLPGVSTDTPAGLDIQILLDAFADGTTDEDLTNVGVLSNDYPNYEIGGSYPIGNHQFEVRLSDGCGNEAVYFLPFEVIDCAAPNPACLNGLAVTLDPHDSNGDGTIDGGIGDVWADDFIVGSPLDCSGEPTYSINRLGNPINIDSTGIFFSCADTGLVEVEVHTWDPLGNRSTCETFLFVQDPDGVCTGDFTPTAAMAGGITTEQGLQVEEVEVSLSGGMGAWMVTGADGSFSFEGLAPGGDYTITPLRDGDDLNGISTLDMLMISKHILGVAPLQSPYQLIAADVNRSGGVSTLDMIALRKLILGDELELTQNTSWRFVEESYVFPDPTNPWEEDFPELLNLNNLPAAGVYGADFVAIKVGDVSLDAQPNNLMGIENRSFEDDFQLQLEDKQLEAGQEYRIEVTANLAAILGYQGSLRFAQATVELVDVLPGVMRQEHFGTSFIDKGVLTLSWNQQLDQPMAKESRLFTLVFYAKEAVALRDVLSFGSRVTPAEAYGKNGDLLDVKVNFRGAAQLANEEPFALHQNQPNPFRGETQISFELPEAGEAQLIISDVAGKVVKVMDLQGTKGYNAITLSHNGLPAGILQYSLRSGQHFATKRMMILAD